jgi:glutamine amidotransferase
MAATVSILDYGVGNLASLANAFGYLGIDCEIVSSVAQVAGCGRLVLPGVGAFGHAMRNLGQQGLDDAVREHAQARARPLLGVCLGMQLLLDHSEEGGHQAGLGLLRGAVRPLQEIAGDLVVPHVGWNDVRVSPASRLLGADASGSAFYFVHGYRCRLDDPAQVTGVTNYGADFDAIAEHENLFGCQFHPEKSQKRGLEILRNFAAC